MYAVNKNSRLQSDQKKNCSFLLNGKELQFFTFFFVCIDKILKKI